MSTNRIGWIGLGNMGIPMVRNLIKAGFAVTIYNRTAGKAAPLQAEGAALAASPLDLCTKSDTVITMVSDDRALREIHEGARGLLEGAPTGKGVTVIDMSTVSPVTTRELGGALAKKGVDYLDAPVSGSVKPAELGQLVIMAGGKKEVYERALPIFERLGKASFYMGDSGSGNAAKLAINLLLAFNMQGLAESVLFAREKGIAPAAMLAVIGESALANGFTKLKTANLVDEQYAPAFALKHLVKDLRLALDQGLHSPGGIVLHDSYQQALAAGLGNEDMSAIAKFLADKTA